MILARTEAELAPFLGGVLVPTMGALHEGHTSLIRLAVRNAIAKRAGGGAPPVVVSLFVNPTQFNDPADFARYPQTLDADLRACEDAGADIVFAPGVETVYPPEQPIAPPPLPDVAQLPMLEDAWRPGHFAGVCQVVSRLFDLTRPVAAVFGEKDWQQLRAVSAMPQPGAPGVEIIPAPTVREPDGLARSSRNRFLTPDERARAAAIPTALCEACAAETPGAAERMMARVLQSSGLRVQYAAVRDAITLMPLRPAQSEPSANPHARALIAVELGDVRLIDNCPWPG